jgi:cytidine deaminase
VTAGCERDGAGREARKEADVTTARGRAPSARERSLYGTAAEVAEGAWAPYSRFAVGAVVAGPSGTLHRGVNVENASYPAGICAERVALGAMVTAGEREARIVAVATADGRDAAPCGLCLQALAEFGDPAVVCKVGGKLRVYALSELLTTPFVTPWT